MAEARSFDGGLSYTIDRSARGRSNMVLRLNAPDGKCYMAGGSLGTAGDNDELILYEKRDDEQGMLLTFLVREVDDWDQPQGGWQRITYKVVAPMLIAHVPFSE